MVDSINKRDVAFASTVISTYLLLSTFDLLPMCTVALKELVSHFEELIPFFQLCVW